ncbi:MAG: coat protein [Lachnospiraceae bacterium]|nr:coat protein [Lachnospiraceae bacterium]
MAGSIFGIPFDEELFMQMWNEAPDPYLTAMIESGAVVNDKVIASRIESNGNIYTIPFYDTLDGDDQNYDGQTDITVSEVGGGSQTGVVYGRAKGFFARNFTAELSGADPMGHIVSSIARYWQKKRQKRMIGLCDAIFGITGTGGYAKTWASNHSINLGSATATARKIEETDLNDLATQACGDNKGEFKLAVMHSDVAKTLENKQLLEYWKYTDANGIQRPMRIASVNGYTAIVDDGVPCTPVGGSDANKDLKQYTTYILGSGVIRTAKGRVDVPVENHREAKKNGGQDELITRMRETIHPNGFSFTIPSTGWSESPTDAQLFAKANWSIKFDPKAIPIARLITNG